MVSVQVASDLHTEFLDDVLDDISSPAAVIGSLLKPSAPFCILAGDNGSVIGPDLPRFYTLLSRASASFRHVFVIAGNHEFYNSVREPVLDDEFDWRAPSIVHAGQVASRLRTLCRAFPNVTYLDRHGGPRWLTADGRVLEAPDPSLPPSAHARLVGCPLWSHVPAHARRSVTKYLNDYRIIVHPPPGWNLGAGATSSVPPALAAAGGSSAGEMRSPAGPASASTGAAGMREDGAEGDGDADADDGSSGASSGAPAAASASAAPGLFRALDFGSPDKASAGSASSEGSPAAAGGAGAGASTTAGASAPVIGAPLPGLGPPAPAAARAGGPALLPLSPAVEAALQAADLLGAPPGYSRLTPDEERELRRGQRSRFPNPASVEARRTAVADFLDSEHASDLAYIVRQAEASTERGEGACIVVTHHAPTFHGTSAPRFRTPLHNPTNHGFATDLAYLFARYGCDDTHTRAAAASSAGAGAGAGAAAVAVAGGGSSGSGARATAAAAAAAGAPAYNSNVRLWVYGHTHFNCDQTLYGTRVVSNQRGYSWTKPGEGGEDDSGPEYRQDFVVDVPLPPP